MGTFILNEDLYWKGILKGIAKATNPMQPVFEAFTNSLEAIDMRKNKGDNFLPYINVDFYFNTDIDGNNDGLEKIVITDNGIGFNNENFKRLKVFKDDRKGFHNRGSGRIQLIHSFKSAEYESIYDDDSNRHYRKFILSKSDRFIENNAILFIEEENDIGQEQEIRTCLKLNGLRTKSDISFFNSKKIEDIKKEILDHYILYFCSKRNNLPKITINYFHIEQIIASREISLVDIPEVSHEDETISVPMSTISSDMKRIESTEQMVDVTIKSYKLPQGQLKKNEIKVTSKGEVIDSIKVKLECLRPDWLIDSSYFLFLLSSSYFDERIGDNRDVFEILNKTEFKKKAKQFGTIDPQIVLDDLEEEVGKKAGEMYSEIALQKNNYEAQLTALKKTYLLSDEALAEANINDSVEDILKKAYAYDARLIAKSDAIYYSKQNDLDKLDPSSPTYKTDLEEVVDDLARSIPLQQKESLSRYVTHRNLVLDLMSKILNKQLDVQQRTGRNADERLLHNLIFTQHSTDTGNSDLWMLNEDYLHFKGVSECPLNQIEIDGQKLFKEEVSEEEERYLTSLGEDRRIKRPDILLFPSEHKCIIVELKTPNTNLSLHLSQIKKYAYFIRNFTCDDFVIDKFYGYLVGEALEPRDVRAADGNFKEDPKFGYMFLPYSPIIYENDTSGKYDGSLYMEILTYSVILERAKLRNKAFTDKLFNNPTVFKKNSGNDVENNTFD